MSSLKLEPLSIKESLMQEFIIQSMSCGGCASRIAQAVKNLDAAAKIEVDLPTKT
ncbi:heavy-metal-associated domain-containing protein, partial [Leifsonia sp. RAF41]|uniref:heavy-metal-associated domain-containing protein n=1 Tax=Leifsonia sp. RAF41 TaxID=3233056 RepID=UPI003F962205